MYSKYLQGLRSMGKEMNKKQMCAITFFIRIPFSSSCNRPLWKFVLRHEFVQCIPGSWSNCIFLRCDWSVASNPIKVNQGENKNKQTPNGKQGSPPLLLEIAATVPPISSSLYMSNSEKGSTHQIHIAPGRGGAWAWTSKTFLEDRCQRGRHKAAGIFVLL